MRRLIQRKWGTSKLIQIKWKSFASARLQRNSCNSPLSSLQDRGSVTLETALVMPMFLLLVFFLLFLVQTSIVMMALHGALSQTVRLTASVWFPISQVQAEAEVDQPGKDGSPTVSSRSDARDTIGEFGQWLPAPLNVWATYLSKDEWSPESEAAKLALRQLVLKLADKQVLDAERLRITDISLPKKNNIAEAYLTLQAEYRLPLRIPWNGRPLVIHASAKERAWVGGSPSRAILPSENNHSLPIAFVSLQPTPVRPGRKATLVLKTRPGASLDLSVTYKSGQSQAKHLGSAVADESGRISWTWLVSGNTTSGEWTWTVRGEGGVSFTHKFQVAR